MGFRSRACRLGLNDRTYADGERPITARRRSIDCSTLATRPKASAAAQNPATSLSAGSSKRRTSWMGSVAESTQLNDA